MNFSVALGLLFSFSLLSCSSEVAARKRIASGGSQATEERGELESAGSSADAKGDLSSVLGESGSGAGRLEDSGRAANEDEQFSGAPSEVVQATAKAGGSLVGDSAKIAEASSSGNESLPENLTSAEKFPVTLSLTAPTAPDAAAIRAGREAIVRTAYWRIVGREAEQAGLSYWVSQLENGQTVSEFRSALENSREGQVASIYFGVLFRDPDLAGLTYWIGQIDSGQSLSQVSVSLQFSAEGANGSLIASRRDAFKATLERRENELQKAISEFRLLFLRPFIEAVYQECLGRSSDKAGFDYWSTQIQNGQLPSASREAICASDEASLATIYFEELGRDPDQEGLDFWFSKLKEGATLEQIRNAIQGSLEAETDRVVARKATFAQTVVSRTNRTNQILAVIPR